MKFTHFLFLFLALLCQQVLSSQTCQLIENQFFVNDALIPHNGYIDVCLGEQLRFENVPLFPENGLIYEQSATTSEFHWVFGDAEVFNSQEFVRTFSSIGAYELHGRITDLFGCQSDYYKIIIRVSAPVQLSISNPPESLYQVGDTVVVYHNALSSDQSPSIDIVPNSSKLPYFADNTNNDTINIPDGFGAVLQKELIVSSFPTGATIGTEFPFEQVWINLFHPYSGDLTIELICPSGESTAMLAYPSNLGSTNFGKLETFQPCNLPQVLLEIPLTYTFINTAANGTLAQFNPNAPTFTYTTPPDSTGVTYTYTDTYFPGGSYQPVEDFSNLNTCPINGVWTLEITDHLLQDGGWLSDWGLDIANQIDSLETDQNITIEWDENATIIDQNQDSTVLLLQESGLIEYGFTVHGFFGCDIDSLLRFDIEPVACQPILNQLFVNDEEVSSGQQIDLCTGESVHLQSIALYPDNNSAYHQSDATSQFSWLFADGNSNNTSTLSKSFTEAGRYQFFYQTTDVLGCQSEPFWLSALVSPSQFTYWTEPSPSEVSYCIGDSVVLYHNYDFINQGYGIFYDPFSILPHYTFNAPTQPLIIPDGTEEDIRLSYYVDSFSDMDTLVSADDIESISVDLVHSYANDLSMELVCPNGQSVALLDFPAGIGSVNLGEPVIDDFVPVDCLFLPGRPYTYDFNENADNPSLDQMTLPLWSTISYYVSCESVDYFIPAQYTIDAGSYQPMQSLDSLIGCPLNGEWQLRVKDHISLDHGWLFGWEMNWTGITDSMPVDSNITTLNWEEHPDIISSNQDSTLIIPGNPGFQFYDWTSSNSGGCNNAFSYAILVLDENDPACLVNTTSELQQTNWIISPNPTTDKFMLRSSLDIGHFSYQVFDLHGQKIQQGQASNEAKINSSNWPAGMYNIRLSTNNSDQFSWKKLIKIED